MPCRDPYRVRPTVAVATTRHAHNRRRPASSPFGAAVPWGLAVAGTVAGPSCRSARWAGVRAFAAYAYPRCRRRRSRSPRPRRQCRGASGARRGQWGHRPSRARTASGRPARGRVPTGRSCWSPWRSFDRAGDVVRHGRTCLAMVSRLAHAHAENAPRLRRRWSGAVTVRGGRPPLRTPAPPAEDAMDLDAALGYTRAQRRCRYSSRSRPTAGRPQHLPVDRRRRGRAGLARTGPDPQPAPRPRVSLPRLAEDFWSPSCSGRRPTSPRWRPPGDATCDELVAYFRDAGQSTRLGRVRAAMVADRRLVPAAADVRVRHGPGLIRPRGRIAASAAAYR